MPRPGSNEKEADWAFELGSPNGLMRQGWTRNSLKQATSSQFWARGRATAARTRTPAP